MSGTDMTLLIIPLYSLMFPQNHVSLFAFDGSKMTSTIYASELHTYTSTTDIIDDLFCTVNDHYRC